MELPDARYARTGDGAYVAYQVVGTQPPDLILSVNAGIPVELMWDEPQVRAALDGLRSVARLIPFDLYCFGSSSRVDATAVPAVQAWMDYFLAVANAADAEHVTVMSWGEACPSAILFAASYPDRVDNLILINPYARFARSESCPWGMPADAVARYVQAIKTVWGTGGVMKTVAPSLVSDAQSERRWARYERLSANPDVVAAMTRSAMESDVTHALHLVQAPTLVLTRRGDRHVRPAHGRFIADAIRDARLVELDGDDHFPFAGDAAAIVAEIQEFLTGVRAVEANDRVLATVLFTDMVGSTSTAAALGDERWHDLLAQHNEIVRRHLHAYRGQEVDTAGDGFFILFDGPARAIQCARSIRADLHRIGVSIRSGIHTGEVQRAHGKVEGIGVHIGARIASEASEGELLVSRTVVDLVVGSGIEFTDKGSYELKGVPGEWQLFAVV